MFIKTGYFSEINFLLYVYVISSWQLWIYIGCEDYSRETIEKFLAELANKKLTQVEILNDSFDSTLVFEDIELHLFATHTYEKEQWMLFTPEKKVFTAGPGSEWSFEESD